MLTNIATNKITAAAISLCVIQDFWWGNYNVNATSSI